MQAWRELLRRKAVRYERVWGAVDEPDHSLLAFPGRVKNYARRKKNGLLRRLGKEQPGLPVQSGIEFGTRAMKKIMPSEEELQRQREESEKFPEKTVFSIIVPLYNTPENYLREMIDSVLEQTYPYLELCMADGSDEEHGYVEEICMEYKKKDDRIKYGRLKENKGISGNTNECLKLASGQFVGLFDHDDLLHPSALYECKKRIDEVNAEVLYTDEMSFREGNVNDIALIHMKPDFSPVNLRGVNYICHFFVFKRDILKDNGLYNEKYDGSQDHDMILRITDASARTEHISKVLYFWRIHPGSTSGNIGVKTYAIDAGINAVHDAEERAGRDNKVNSVAIIATHYRVRYNKPEGSITEIKITPEDNGRTLNEKVKAADGDYIFFVKEGLEVVNDPDYTVPQQELLGFASQSHIGVAGGRVIDREGFLVESGYVIGMTRKDPFHSIDRGMLFDEYGYMGRHYYTHHVTAVSLDVCMVKKEDYISVGGICEDLSDVVMMGIDLSLSLKEKGLYTVLDPYAIYATKKHIGSIKKSEKYVEDGKIVIGRFLDEFKAGDAYYPIQASRNGDFSFDEERL